MRLENTVHLIGQSLAAEQLSELRRSYVLISYRSIAEAHRLWEDPAPVVFCLEEPYSATELSELARRCPVLAVTRSRPRPAVERELFRLGVQEIVSLARFSRGQFMMALERAIMRFERSKEVLDRERMFSALCDKLPFQMAYRIVVKPGCAPKFVYVSDGVRHISGLSRREVMDDPEILYRQILPEDRIRLDEAERRAVETLSPLEIELRKTDATGQIKWVHIRSFPSRSPDGTVTWDGIESNITSYKESEDAVKQLLLKNEMLLESERHARSESERSSRMKDEFLATLSHELRTPINSVLGWIQLMRRGSLAKDMEERAISIVERNARVQAQLISDLLDMNRIISGKVQLEMCPVDLKQFVLASIESIRPASDAKQLSVSFDYGDQSEVLVEADTAKLQQVLANLLSNAVKFTAERGFIQVRLTQEHGLASISIADSGTGIKADFLPYVFDRFRQADASSSRKYGGLGLGLAIVKHLVTLHRGYVKAESDGEGRGATFTIALPLLTASGRRPLDPGKMTLPPLSISSPLASMSILLVDDEPDALELLSHVFQQNGAEVTAARSAADALSRISTAPRRFHAIVSDIGMPEQDGCEFLAEARRRYPFITETPAIALTAFARPEDRRRVLSAGFLLHVTKPVDPIEVIYAVKSVIGEHREASVMNG